MSDKEQHNDELVGGSSFRPPSNLGDGIQGMAQEANQLHRHNHNADEAAQVSQDFNETAQAFDLNHDGKVDFSDFIGGAGTNQPTNQPEDNPLGTIGDALRRHQQ